MQKPILKQKINSLKYKNPIKEIRKIANINHKRDHRHQNNSNLQEYNLGNQTNSKYNKSLVQI